MRTRPAIVVAGAALAIPAAFPAQSTWAGGTTPPPLTQSTLTRPAQTTGPDNFGYSVAASGHVVVVSAPGTAAHGSSGGGAVYVYDRPTTGWHDAAPIATLTAPDGNGGFFGNSVSIDGATIVVGAESTTVGANSAQGAAYVFTEPKGGWKTTAIPTATLTSADGGVHDWFGHSVSVSGDTVAVGAMYHQDPTNLTDAGAVYVFTKPTGEWSSTSTSAELIPNNVAADDQFGALVRISGDTLVATSPERLSEIGGAYVFVKPKTGGWVSGVQTRRLRGSGVSGTEFGDGLALSGNTVAVASPDEKEGSNAEQGAVYVFSMPSAGWGTHSDPPLDPTATLTASDGAVDDRLGTSVSLDGTTVWASAPDQMLDSKGYAGGVYAFDEPGAGWSSEHQTSEVRPTTTSGFTYFGGEIAADSTALVVGNEEAQGEYGTADLDAIAGPTVAKVKQSHASWTLGSHAAKVNPSHKPHGGTMFSLRLSETATVSLAFTEKVHGHTKKKGTIRFTGEPGTSKVYVDGTTHGKTLVAGKCTVKISATNTYGTAHATTLHFTTKAKK